MKNIGVICFDLDDFNKYMDCFYKNTPFILNRKNIRKTDKEMYVAIHSVNNFIGCTYDAYVITYNAHINKDILEILKLAPLLTRVN